MNNIYAALEIGTTRTVLAIGEAVTGGRLKITCHASIPSTGVRKSQILDISQATQSIRAVIGAIEKKQGEAGQNVTIGNAFLTVSGQHIHADPFQGIVQVEKTRVDDADITEVMQKSRQAPVSRDRELLDIADQDFALDALGGISTPKGMSGRFLKLNTLQISADKHRIDDARTAADGAHLEIREPLFATTCAADAVLEDYERKNGVLVIDFGGGSTGYALYCDGYLNTTGVVGVGGDHITNDIAHAFQTTNNQAETLKREQSRAIVGNYGQDDARVHVAGSSTLMENRTISRRALDIVVNARMKETLSVIREALEERDLLNRLHAGIVITGGGASLRDIEPLVEQELMAKVRKGRPLEIDGLENEEAPWSYAATAGALLYAHHNYEEKSILDGIFGRFFK